MSVLSCITLGFITARFFISAKESRMTLQDHGWVHDFLKDLASRKAADVLAAKGRQGGKGIYTFHYASRLNSPQRMTLARANHRFPEGRHHEKVSIVFQGGVAVVDDC